MPSFAFAQITGHLGQDPEVRYTEGGLAVAKFSVATSKKSRDEESTTWWSVAVFGKQAEACGEYLRKGSLVAVAGEPTLRKYTKRDGEEGFSLDLAASSVKFMDTKKDRGAPSDDDVPF